MQKSLAAKRVWSEATELPRSASRAEATERRWRISISMIPAGFSSRDRRTAIR